MAVTATGKAGRPGRSALLVIDMLNTYEHPDAAPLARSVARALPAIRRRIDAARRSQELLVYVNDNYGDWSACREESAGRAMDGARPDLVEPVLPRAGDAFLTKARHSAFYETQLEYVLRREGVDRVVLTGQVTEQCILYTALDAYVRHLRILVPADAVAHIHPPLARAALRMMQLNMGAELAGGGRGAREASEARSAA